MMYQLPTWPLPLGACWALLTHPEEDLIFPPIGSLLLSQSHSVSGIPIPNPGTFLSTPRILKPVSSISESTIGLEFNHISASLLHIYLYAIRVPWCTAVSSCVVSLHSVLQSNRGDVWKPQIWSCHLCLKFHDGFPLCKLNSLWWPL